MPKLLKCHIMTFLQGHYPSVPSGTPVTERWMVRLSPFDADTLLVVTLIPPSGRKGCAHPPSGEIK